jgi:hypothetical protein
MSEDTDFYAQKLKEQKEFEVYLEKVCEKAVKDVTRGQQKKK